jgi:hypothetical protein
MGVWGTRLYSGDFALDLRSTIGAVARLPFDGDRLAEIVAETEPASAGQPDDSDHTTFWLVLADQFAKRVIASDRVRDKALEIIDSGADLAALKKLGMNDSGLKQRAAMLADLRRRLEAPLPAGKTRPVLKKPPSLLMELGDVFVYPTCRGKNINPYFKSKELEKMWINGASVPWTQDGWSALVIVDLGRAFDFLPWYRPVTLSPAVSAKPTLDELRVGRPWRLGRAGTCSAVRMKRMELEKIGRFRIDPEVIRQTFPGLKPGISAAVSDICICNGLGVSSSQRPGSVTTLEFTENLR